MKRCIKNAIAVFLLAAIAAPWLLLAGPNGKITGTVKDSKTGEVLPGVNVMIDGTTMGAATNTRGEFSIINVPAGVYTLKASMIGYARLTKQNIRVLPDFTTRVDFDLKEEELSGEEVVIVAERPLIQKDQTMTMSVTSSEEIKNLPVRGFQAVANLGTGFTINNQSRNLEGGTANVNVRGGRASETGVYLDGFLQNNLLTGTSNVQVTNSAVEEILAITGGFNAEYGRNQSGIIQIITKSGGKRYSGSLEYVTDAIAPAFATGKYGYQNGSFGFGGPIIPGNDKYKFFVSGEGQIFDDGEPSIFGFPTWTTSYMGSGANALFRDQNQYFDWGKDSIALDYVVNEDGSVTVKYGDRKARPKNQSGEGSNSFIYGTMQGKFSFIISDALKLDLNGNYGHNIRRAFTNYRATVLDHVQRNDSRYWQIGGIATYTVNPNSFFEFGGNYNLNDRRYMDDKWGWNLNWNEDLLGTTKSSIGGFGLHSLPGNSNAVFGRDFDSYFALKTSYTNQINKNHLIKAGMDFYRHTIRLLDVNELRTNPIEGANNYIGYRITRDNNGRLVIKEVNKDDYTNTLVTSKGDTILFPLDGAKHPISFSAFVQDKLEYEGLIMNVGLRYDLFNPGTKRIRDFYNPLGEPGTSDPLIIGPEDFTSGKSDHKISPRLSISFPVSEKTIFRMSWGKFFQQPNLQNLYISSYFYNRMVTAAPFATTIQNPNLQAEESIQYEVGMQYALTDNLKMDVSAYYRDINNLINVENFTVNPAGGWKSLILYGNHDRGIVKGVSYSMELRRTKKISGRFSYTLQWANGTGSDDASGFRAAWLGFSATKFNAPLSFDQRHRINVLVDVRNGKKEGPEWGGYLLQNAGVNFIVTAASGFPYTPQAPTSMGESVPSGKPIGRRNSQYGPWTFRTDLKMDKTVYMTNNLNAQIYLQVFNLLDTKNATSVYNATGSANDDGFLASPVGQAQLASAGPVYAAYYDTRLKNGLFYDTPRQVRLGIALNF